MSDNKHNGNGKREVDYYLQRLDDDFRAIIENQKRNITDLAREMGEFKSEIESLRERLHNIRGWTEAASKIRYLPNTDPDAILANLIDQVLLESNNIAELKPVHPTKVEQLESEEVFDILAKARDVKIEEAFEGFDFYENNPYKESAEKKLAKMEKKKKK